MFDTVLFVHYYKKIIFYNKVACKKFKLLCKIHDAGMPKLTDKESHKLLILFPKINKN
jgi:hypothetical protein